MHPRIDTRNTYYLRNVHNQQYISVSGSKVSSGAQVENPSHQVSVESPYSLAEITSDAKYIVEIHPSRIHV